MLGHLGCIPLCSPAFVRRVRCEKVTVILATSQSRRNLPYAVAKMEILLYPNRDMSKDRMAPERPPAR